MSNSESNTGQAAYDNSDLAPEVWLSCMLRTELGVHVEPQALRLFIRYHWGSIHKLAHEIHEGK